MQSGATTRSSNEPTARILIVEDERIVAQDLTHTLVDLGYTVVGVASSAEQALAQAHEVKPDLILMDIRLPGGMDGIDAARKIGRSQGPPVVFLTAHSDDQTLRRVTESEPFGFVVKPFKEAELRCAIDIALRKYRHQAQLEATSQERQAFSHSVAHDLRGPLLSIDGLSQALIEDHAPHLDVEALDYLQRVRNASQHMRQLIEDLLRLGKVTADDLVFKPVDLSAIARRIGAALKDAEPERHLNFRVQEGVRTRGDASLLRLVLENLFRNAWKFTALEPAPSVEFGAFDQNGKQICFVRDNGVGFDMEYAAKLFEPFHRLHSQSQFEGTGLGLAIVRQIINRHHGKIWAEAKLDEGATFYFYLDPPTP